MTKLKENYRKENNCKNILSNSCSNSFSSSCSNSNRHVVINFISQPRCETHNFDFSNIKNVNCPKIPILICKNSNTEHEFVKTVSLLDSGASFSAISTELFELCSDKFKLEKVERARGDPSQADSSKLICDGETITQILIRNNKGDQIKLLNVRLTIIRNLSYQVILGMDILEKLKFQLNNNAVSLSGKIFKTENKVITMKTHSIKHFTYDKVMTISQVTLSRSPWTSSDTATLYEVEDGSRNTFYYFCCINQTEAELEGDVRVNMVHESVKSRRHFDFRPKVKSYSGKVLWSGQLDINALNNKVNIKDRILIDENFYKPIVGKSNFNMQMKEKLKTLLSKYRHIFSRDETDIGLYIDEEVDVKLKDPNMHPPYLRARPIPHAAKEFVREKVKQLTKNGIFEEVKKGSAYNSPCHIVMTKKEDGTTKFRLCVDYSQLNKYLIPDCYPIPRIRDIINDLEGAQFFSSIDLRSGFWNLKLKATCRDLLSFSVGQKQLRPVRLPMGLCTSPSIFQRVMRTIMSKFLNDFVHIYIDDCIIYSKSADDHLIHIGKVLQAFERSGILLNAGKCIFGVTSLDYLGFNITNKGWRILPKRRKEIENFPTPKNQSDVKRFIGVVGFLTACCQNLQFLLDPLHKISGKKAKFKWTEKEDQAFQKIKDVILKSVMMSYPKEDPSYTMYLSTDSSDIGWGGVLSQLNEKGIEQPLGFCSGAWKNSECNWDIRNKEFHALVNSLDYFYEFLFGRSFIWRCDNQALAFLKNSLTGKSLKKNQRILRSLDFINQFNFTFELKKGTEKEMAIPDYLSRVQPNCSINSISELHKIDISNFWSRNECSLDEFLTKQENDEALKDKSSFNKNRNWKFLRDRGLQFEICKETGLRKGIIDDKEKILVPAEYENKMIEFWHLPIHRSPNEIKKKLNSYLFPKMNDKISKFVKNCATCCSIKPDKSYHASMTKTSTPKHPWSTIMVDLLGPYPQTLNGSKYIMVTICQLTGYTVLKTLSNKTAAEVAKKFNEIFNQYGLPLGCASDNGKEFKNDLLKTYFEKLMISQNFSTPYRPRTQGQVERVNQEILKIQKILKSSDEDWDEDIQLIAFIINNTFNRNIGLSPFEAFHGWAPIVPSLATYPRLPKNDLRQIDFELATRIMKHRIVLNELFAQRELIKARSQIPEESPLEVGTEVLFKSERPVGSSKLFNPWLGLFVVIKRVDNDSYLISPKDDKRKQYLAYRGRLRRIGTSSNAVTKTHHDEANKDENSEDFQKHKEIPVKEEQENKSQIEDQAVRYKLRKRHDTDYRKFF